jgi:acyl-[acyl-carrier-protein] desaturase
MEDTALLVDLAPVAERYLERHLSMAKEWFPHELVPWGSGRDFEPGQAWDPEEYPLPPAVRSALLVNLLTEDNLPYYFHAIEGLFPTSDPGGSVWATWNRRWTAEEGRHSIVIRDWLTVTRAIDPVALERGRMHQVCTGFSQPIDGACEGLAYVTLQELATRISHRNTGRLLADGPGRELMTRVAADENLHYLFYRDVATAAIERDPSRMVMAIERQVREFEMPGTGILGFQTHATAIAGAGIYDFAIHHDQILVPVVLRHWRVESLEGLTPEAEHARARLVRRIERIGKVARRLAERREEMAGASS